MRRPHTRAEQKEATRARLLKIGRRIFVRRGYDATSIALVCREARVTHGALYHHFPSKEALLAAVVGEVFAEVAERVREATGGKQGWAQIEAACDAYLEACTDPEVQLFLFQDGPRVLSRADFDSIDHAVNAPLVVGLFERWMAEGLLEARPVSFVARTLGAAFAEAGVIIREAEAPAHARAQLRALLSTWLAALKRAPEPAVRPVLATERLLLHPWEPSDEAALVEATGFAQVCHYLFDGKPPGAAWVQHAIRASRAAFERGDVGSWLARGGDGELVGFAGFQAGEGGAGELVVATLPDKQRRGYAREMAKSVLAEAKARHRTRILATADAANVGSVRLLEQLGFVAVARRPGPLGDVIEYVLPLEASA
ncbi:MAG TPA: GNAT family N-acetyltransferase [Polyangiaceae bacterium]|nr:GNAT family N-acetyltransferase [Polyangiaceae bacterium]